MHGQHHSLAVLLVVQQHWSTYDGLPAPIVGNMISNAGPIDLPTNIPDMN
jgi:hypothetical protein